MNGINEIQSPFSLQQQKIEPQKERISTAQAQQTFKETLSEALNNVNDLQLKSKHETEQLVNGHSDDLHNVMITGQKANITLQATVEVRNKVIEAYQEIMRMQV